MFLDASGNKKDYFKQEKKEER